MMEKGNEGDEIIFLSFRQIECHIPDDIVKVGQISPDLLVAIIARSLLLISNGEITVRMNPFYCMFSLILFVSLYSSL